MADDLEIIKQIEKQLGIELKPVPLEKIMNGKGQAGDRPGKHPL